MAEILRETIRIQSATRAGIIRVEGGPTGSYGHASGRWHYFVTSPTDSTEYHHTYKAHSEKDARRVARCWDLKEAK